MKILQEISNVTDKDDADALKYPAIKTLAGESPEEIKLDIVMRDINPPETAGTLYFPLDFCTRKIVIDLVAKKYRADAENYFKNGSDEDRFLIGYDACSKQTRNALDCPYLQKFNQRLDTFKNISQKEIFAIYLLELDESDYNNQKFLFMTRSGIYLFYATKELESYGYNQIRFTPDGITFAQDSEKNLLNWEFNEKFLSFAQEFMLLRCTTLADVRTRHPLADLRDDENNPDMVTDISDSINLVTSENEVRPPYSQRNAYLKFLVNVATAEGYLDAETMLRIAYMAREFKVSADELQSWLNDAYEGIFLKKKLQPLLVEVLKTIGEKNKFALVQDAIEFITDSSGNSHRDELLKIFRRAQFGVEKFAENYLAYVQKRNAAKKDLQLALQDIEKPLLHLKSAVRMQNYNNALNLQVTTMEAILNGK